MQILSLKLENTKSYAETFVPFTEGTNAIVGRNGAGKSTILEAIGFALFDHLPYNQNDFVREGAKSATVTVTFASSADDRPYDVVRRCGSSGAHFVYDPETASRVCEGKADVLSFLKQHMGVDPSADLAKLFSDAVGVPQGTLTAAFLQTPGPRKTTFDPLLQVAEYKDAVDRLREPVRLLKDRLQAGEVTIADLRARLERLPDLQAEAQALTESLAQTEGEHATVTVELEEARTQLLAQEALRSQVQHTRTERASAAQRVVNLAERLAAATQRQDRAAAAQAVVQAQQPGHDAYVAAQSAKAQLDTQIGQRQRLQQQQSQLDKTLSQIGAELAAATRTLAEIDAAERRVAELTPLVDQQKSLDTALDQARQQVALFNQTQAALAAQQAQHARLVQRAAALQSELDQGQALQEQLAKINADLTAAEALVDAQRAARIHRGAEQESIEQQQEALQQAEGAACPVCEQPLTPEHRAEMLARNSARLAELLQEDRAAQSALSAAQNEVKKLTAGRKTLESALQQLPRPQEIERLAAQIAALGEEIEPLSAQVEAGAGAEAEVATLTQELADLGNPRQEQAIAARTAQRRDAVEREQARLQAQAAQQEQALAELAGQLASFADLDQKLAATAEDLARHLPAYQAVLANRQTAQTLVTEQAEVARLTQTQAEAEAALSAAEAALAQAEADFDAEAFAATAGQVQLATQRQATLDAELRMGRERMTRLDADLADLAQRQVALSAAQERQTHLSGQMALLEAMRGVLRQAGPYITAALVQQISHNAAQLFGDIMQDYTRRLAWGEDYGITLEVNGNQRAFAQLSGGEQMAAALSVRLALLREMSSIDVAFFDEPTTNLDEARRESLAQQILAVKGFRQLFVISHDDTFEQATENLIRVNKIDGRSVVENG